LKPSDRRVFSILHSMKAGYLILALLICSFTKAQSGFAKQFRDILNDTANGFSRYREGIGDTLISRGDSFIQYFSLSNLEHTTGNKILYVGDTERSTYAYIAYIADSTSESEGKMICDLWKDKITAVMGSACEMKKYETGNGFSGNYGWSFSGEKFDISIDMFPVGDTALKRVSLMVSYFIYHKLK
jgi:hypothetical protein